MKSKPFSALFGLLALVAILGVAPAFGSTEVDIQAGAGSSASAACVTTSNCFSPNPANIAPGDEVEWKNTDSVSHTVTSGKVSDDNAGSMFDSGLIKKGNEFKFTFATAGTYDYFCTVHPWMVGQVVVGGAAATGQNAPGNQTGIPLGAPYTAGNAAVPEFGPVAGIVLAIAVLSMVVFAAKSRVIPRL